VVIFVIVESALVPVVVGMGTKVEIEAEWVGGVSRGADRRSGSSTIGWTRRCWDLLRGTRHTR
jgi:hypothetical protein